MNAMPPRMFFRKNENCTAEQLYENCRNWRRRDFCSLPNAMLRDRKIVLRLVMQFAHDIRKQASWLMDNVSWSECLKLAWAEVKAGLRQFGIN